MEAAGKAFEEEVRVALGIERCLGTHQVDSVGEGHWACGAKGMWSCFLSQYSWHRALKLV